MTRYCENGTCDLTIQLESRSFEKLVHFIFMIIIRERNIWRLIWICFKILKNEENVES